MTAGGRRPGAGRPKAEPTRTVSLRLTKRDYAAYLLLGGSQWIKQLIDTHEETKLSGQSSEGLHHETMELNFLADE